MILEPPSFVVNVTYRERIIREGTNLTENCATVGELGMSVKWIKDEFLVAKEGINSSTLTISNIDRCQDGMYSCVGTNNLTTIRRWINVSVICKYTDKYNNSMTLAFLLFILVISRITVCMDTYWIYFHIHIYLYIQGERGRGTGKGRWRWRWREREGGGEWGRVGEKERKKERKKGGERELCLNMVFP